MSEQCGFKGLIPGKTYYSVCCGQVTPIVFLRDLSGVKFEYKTLTSDYVHSSYYSDYGVHDAPTCNYKNVLNCIYADEESALAYIQTERYSHILENHNNLCKDLDFLLGYD